jgi:hypothetical protein
MQPRNQLLRDGFSVNTKELGGNAGHSPSKCNTGSFNQDTIVQRMPEIKTRNRKDDMQPLLKTF